MLDWYLALHLLPLLVVLTPVVLLTFRKWHWRFVDLLGAVLPGLIWLYLIEVEGSRGRSLSNFVELPLLAVMVAALSFSKPHAERRIPAPYAKYAFLLLTTSAAVVLYLLFPPLDE